MSSDDDLERDYTLSRKEGWFNARRDPAARQAHVRTRERSSMRSAATGSPSL